MTLGTEVRVAEVWAWRPATSVATGILVRLTVAMTLAMSALGMLVPVVPRRLEEIGSGVQALGLMIGVAAFAQFLAAPVMGALGDRVGRRPLLLVAFGTYVAVAAVFAAASALGPFLAIRGVEGALTAGLFPAASAMISDLLPKESRARWVGIVGASYSIGFVVGPLIGGAIYDASGSSTTFAVTAGLAALSVLVALSIPETLRAPVVPRRDRSGGRRRFSLPSGTVRVLLAIDFLVMFAFGFISPQLVFFAFDEAGLSTTQLGIVIASSSLAMAVGQTAFGGLSDRTGRKPVVVIGLFAYAATFPLYVPFHTAVSIPIIAAVAGLAFGILAPAFTAFYLDTAAESERTKVLGIRTSVMSAGAFLGPLTLALVRQWSTPEFAFVITGIALLIPAVVALVFLPAPGAGGDDAGERAQVAGATLIGVIAHVQTTRGQQPSAN